MSEDRADAIQGLERRIAELQLRMAADQAELARLKRKRASWIGVQASRDARRLRIEAEIEMVSNAFVGVDWGRQTAREIAERTGLPLRTVYRRIDQLAATPNDEEPADDGEPQPPGCSLHF